MRKLILLFALLLPGLTPVAACAAAPAEVVVYDRTARQLLPIHVHDGRRYIAGEPGHEYEIRVRSRDARRLLAVTSVDGINVITGETAATGQGGYIVDGRSVVTIDGWRKSLDDVAAFYFTALPDSYAARTGRPDDVGVIGVALFRERARRCCEERMDRAQSQPAPAASAPEPGAHDKAGAGAAERESARLGTGHGQRLASSARYVDFERASETPDAVVTIYYDSRRNLVAQGVLPRRHYARRSPEPFPGGFVPDP